MGRLAGGPTTKVFLFLGLLVVGSVGFVRSPREPYRVAFDLTSRDTMEQKAVLRWLREVGASSPDAQMEVVMYGKGFELVIPERSSYAADVQTAMRNPNVKFKVCAMAMKNNNIVASQLMPGVEVVPDGIQELVMKQQDHWGYIKVMH
jgi:intracellular sulfur oxidation DsrE/DsrF family protein